MKNKNYTFIFFNTIFISILWCISSSGIIDSNNSFLQWSAIISCLLSVILELGGEFIIFGIYSYKYECKMNFKMLLFIIIVNIVTMKLLEPNMEYLLIALVISNQIFGILVGNFIKNRVAGISKI